MQEQIRLVGVVDNYGRDGKPAGCMDEVPMKKMMSGEDDPRLQDVCRKAREGYYHELAVQNPTQDQLDERGNIIPPGCLGRPNMKVRKSRIPPEVEEKIRSGAYRELARYMSEHEVKDEGN